MSHQPSTLAVRKTVCCTYHVLVGELLSSGCRQPTTEYVYVEGGRWCGSVRRCACAVSPVYCCDWYCVMPLFVYGGKMMQQQQHSCGKDPLACSTVLVEQGPTLGFKNEVILNHKAFCRIWAAASRDFWQGLQSLSVCISVCISGRIKGCEPNGMCVQCRACGQAAVSMLCFSEDSCALCMFAQLSCCRTACLCTATVRTGCVASYFRL